MPPPPATASMAAHAAGTVDADVMKPASAVKMVARCASV